jgi:3-mercaptopyruvate sulfurtransferase SseA
MNRNPTRYFLVFAVLLATSLACTSILPDLPLAPTEAVYPEIERVAPEVAYSAFTAGAAVIVDVRNAGAYAESHIPGALSIPLDELPGRLDEFELDQWIITYCT